MSARAACRLRVAAATALVAAVAVQVLLPRDAPTWHALLAPYSSGAPLPAGFRIDAIRRGGGNDVVLDVRRPADGAAVEVHLLPRGRWPGIRESASFGIGYETPRSPARERELVTEALANAVRARDPGGLPAPDAIPLGDADATAMPRAAEMLRGVRGMLVGIAAVLLAALALVPHPALPWAAVLLALALVAAGAIGPLGAGIDPGGPWLVPLAAVLVLVAGRERRPLDPLDRRGALVLGAGALLLRLAFGAWGPLHVNGYGPLFILAAAREPERIAHYGPGYLELFAPVAALLPQQPDRAVFVTNALLSALLAPLAYGLARLLGLPRIVAAAAGVLVALDPVAIRMAVTPSYLPVLILLCAAAAACLLLGARALDDRAPWRGAGAWLAAGLLLAQAVRTHPSAWGVAATVPAVLLAGARPWSRALAQAAAAALCCAGVIVATSGGVLLDVFGNIRAGTIMRPQAPPALQPLAWLAVGAAAYALLARHRRLVVPAGCALAALLLTRHGYAQSWIWQQAYDRLYLLMPLLALAALLPAALARARVLLATAAVALAGVWLYAGLPIITARTTDHYEYRWMRRQLQSVPAGCRISYVALAGERSLVLPTYVGPERSAVLIDPRAPHTIEAALAPADCHIHIRPSLCASPEGRELCDAIAGQLSLAPVARATFPAIPSSRHLSYDSDPVEAVIYQAVTAGPAERRDGNQGDG